MKGKEIIKEFCASLPEKPGIYKLIGDKEEILYIGKAKNLKKRVNYYWKDDLPLRLERMVFEVKRAEYIVTTNEAEAFLLEASLIKHNQPRFNILLKDDKSFPFIKITTEEEFPKLLKYRGKNPSGEKLFGPYASIADLEKTLNIIKKIFKLRSCSDHYFHTRKRPCLEYQIKRCSAPCTEKISKEEYRENVQDAISFLSGETTSLQNKLAEEMQEFSAQMKFEKAAEIRDNIKALTYAQQRSGVIDVELKDADVIICIEKSGLFCVEVFLYRSNQNCGSMSYFPRHTEDSTEEEVLSSFIGQFYQTRKSPDKIITNIKLSEKSSIEDALYKLHNIKTKIIANNKTHKKILDHALINTKETLEKRLSAELKSGRIFTELKELFGVEDEIERIEVYDNSHIMGKFAVGAMIVAGAEGLDKSQYRKFTIQSSDNGDDYQMLREVLTRRLKRLEKEPARKPSLIIIDGGASHLAVAAEIFGQFDFDIPFITMSKGERRDAGFETFHVLGKSPFTLDNRNHVMQYLQNLRDEAHRFAITSHKNKRAKSLRSSILDDIPNIGAKRKKLLLNYFGSVDAIKGASIDDIKKIEGISAKIAEQIFSYFEIL